MTEEMTTIEKLFVQIFERKRRIIDRVKHQVDLYDQHLASKCLIDGIAPPPWLWPPSLPSQSSSPNELNKDELISGLLLPHPRPGIPYSSNHCSLYQQPVVTDDNGELQDVLYTGLHASSKGFADGDELPVSLQNPFDDAGCVSTGVCEQDPCVTSPQDCRNAIIPDSQCEPALSLARIHRSRSRQRALELRNSAKASKSRLNDKNNRGSCDSQTTRTGIATLQFGHVNELEFVKPVNISNEGCAAEEANGSDLQSEARGGNVYSGRITRSRSSGQEASFVSESLNVGKSSPISKEDGGTPRDSIGKSKQKACQFTESLGAVRSTISNTSHRLKKAAVRDSWSKETESNNYCGRITRSRSSCQQQNCVNECLNLGSSSDTDKEGGISKLMQQPKRVTGNKELIKLLDVIDENCGVKAKAEDCGSKENSTYQYAGRNPRVGATSAVAGLAKPIDSSSALGCTVAPSASTASDVLPIGESLKRFEGVDPQEGADAQVKCFCDTHGSEAVVSEICDAIVADTDADSDVQVKSLSVSPESNLEDAHLRVGAEVLAACSPHHLAMFVKPKQLDFDDVEEYRVNEASGLELEKERQERSSKKPFTPLPSVKHSMPIDCRETFKSSEEIQVPEEQEALNKEGKSCISACDAHAELTYGVNIISGSNIVSSVNETPEIQKDAVTHDPQESNRISKPDSLTGQSTKSRASCENSLETPKEALISSVSDIQADKKRDFSMDENIGQHEVVKPMNSFPGASNQDNVACTGHRMSTDFCIVEPVPLWNPDAILREPATEYPSATSIDGTKVDFAWQKMNSGHSQSRVENAYCRESCVTDDRNIVCSKSSENDIANKSMQPFNRFSLNMEGSWLQRKRRKIDSQLSNKLPTPPSLPDDVVESNAGKSPVGEIHESMRQRMVEGSVSSPKVQIEEGQLSLKGRHKMADSYSASAQEELGILLVSSLTKHSSRDSQGCPLEETEAAVPISFVIEARQLSTEGNQVSRQLSTEGNQVSLHHEDELKITEHLSFSEETLQDKISNLQGNGEVSQNLVGSSNGGSRELIGIDQTLPIFEGFIMQTDDERPCIGKHISVDKLELPKTTIERASILEQLCKSACMNTPSSHFPTTYKFHERPNLHQSVPTGLLESIGLKSSIAINDDAGKELESSSVCLNVGVEHPSHRRSHFDCLNFNAESPWDIRKPCTSPIGKIWDRNMSESGSSEKRGSLNPELPCISEENENADEAADTFQEGICLEEMTKSVNRKQLADLIENLNPPASISEAEVPVERHSLASINTEFSYAGLSSRAKQKVGNQTSSKRRHNKKGKENRSILLGASGARRAMESLNNRSNKPKLSGKTSLRNQGPSLSGREPKCNNIVSNISSFIPLVQQKQATGVTTGKRDIKVKALEAAEAAKRLAEKKENERRMKKEAMKLKRARIGQENMRQLEMQKKTREEERKKKEADLAERKRQREEEERKGKERKRKRVEETQRQQQEHKQKLRAEKEETELKCGATDEIAHERNESKDEFRQLEKVKGGRRDDNLGKMPEMEPTSARVSAHDARKTNVVLEDSDALSDSGVNSKVKIDFGKAPETDAFVANTIEESYEISPYKGSDDEDEEEDDTPNSKFIPSWASKKCLALAVCSQQSLDPEKIFPPDSFCSITEVLRLRNHQLR